MRMLSLAAMIGLFAASAAIAGNYGPRPANKPAHTAIDPARTPADPAHGANDHRPDDRGQIASGCNHRAKDRELIGIDRQDYVEWCTSRGWRYDRSHMDNYWNDDRNCYGQANDRGMVGDRREQFLSRCLDRDDNRRRQ